MARCAAHSIRWRRSERDARQAFTLIEILLVLAIIAVVTAATAPTFVRSIRGNRLRAATEQVVMAGRYARSMAVMRQQEMHLVFDLENSRIRVEPAARVTDGSDAPADDAAEERDGTLRIGEADGLADAPDAGATRGTMDVQVERELDRVRIESVETSDLEGARATEGMRAVRYFSNGTCRPYSVTIRDEFDTLVTVDVDALGSAETETHDF